MIRKDNGSNNSLFLSYQMGLSDGTFFMIKFTQFPNGNHPISSPICPMGVADSLEPLLVKPLWSCPSYVPMAAPLNLLEWGSVFDAFSRWLSSIMLSTMSEMSPSTAKPS